MRTLLDIEKGYIAGLLDGEGCIAILKNNNTYTQRVNISNTNKETLDWIQNRLGFGNVKPKQQTGNRRQGYDWCTGDHEEIRQLIELVLPILRIKKKQALLILEFISLGYAAGGVGMTPRIQAHRSLIYDEMAELNKRGL